MLKSVNCFAVLAMSRLSRLLVACSLIGADADRDAVLLTRNGGCCLLACLLAVANEGTPMKSLVLYSGVESGRRNTHLVALRASREWDALRSRLRSLPNHCVVVERGGFGDWTHFAGEEGRLTQRGQNLATSSSPTFVALQRTCPSAAESSLAISLHAQFVLHGGMVIICCLYSNRSWLCRCSRPPLLLSLPA